MKNNREHRHEKVTRKSLAAALRKLPKLPVPGTLRSRLLGAIPDTASCLPAGRRCISLRKAWAGAAAVILVCALALVVNYGPSLFSNKVTAEVNIVDHNSTQIVDTNRAGFADR